jgi:hypothetical protein
MKELYHYFTNLELRSVSVFSNPLLPYAKIPHYNHNPAAPIKVYVNSTDIKLDMGFAK